LALGKGRATSDAILLLQHYVVEGFEKCESAKMATKVMVFFFDISKAFDTVPHEMLIHQLRNKFFLPHNWLTFLRSYLTGRTMKVKVGNSCPVDSGVPQGSVLGPSLFLAYINAVADLKFSINSRIILFADDIALIHLLRSLCHPNAR
jgi:hypothetical protein